MSKKHYLYPSLLLVSGFVINSLANLRGLQWDRDVDYLMYHGSRVLNGELPWVKEFDDKLPLIHFIFILPGWFGSIRIWQLLSFLVVLGAGVFTWYSLRRILSRDWGFSPSVAKAVALIVAAAAVYSYSVLPTSISSINPLSASFFTTAMFLLLDTDPARAKGLRSFLTPRSITAAFCAAVAISIRPYFVLPGIIIGAWKLLRSRIMVLDSPRRLPGGPETLWKGLVSDSFSLIAWCLSIATFGIILNYSPYLLTGNSQAFVAGLTMLSQKLIPSYYPDVLRRQLFDFVRVDNISFFLLAAVPAMVVIGCALIGRSSRNNPQHWRVRTLDALIACLLLPLLLEVVILQKHYYPHYIQMFVPFAVVSAAFALALCSEQVDQISLGRKASFLALVFSVFVLMSLMRVELIGSLAEIATPMLDPRLKEYAALTSSGTAAKLRRQGFLYPESMYLHWRIGESRHGFPNPYNTLLINQDSWENKISIPAYFDSKLPTSKKDYCRMLINKGPVYILSRDLDVATCLEKDLLRTYSKDQVVDVPTSGEDVAHPLLIYKHR